MAMVIVQVRILRSMQNFARFMAGGLGLGFLGLGLSRILGF
jgi:hypothetical protein